MMKYRLVQHFGNGFQLPRVLDEVNPFLDMILQLCLGLRELRQLDEVMANLIEIAVAGNFLSPLAAGEIVRKVVEENEIENVDGDDLVELRVRLAFEQLVRAGLAPSHLHERIRKRSGAGVVDRPLLKPATYATCISTTNVTPRVATHFAARKLFCRYLGLGLRRDSARSRSRWRALRRAGARR